jgi:hypothetical protein
MSWYSPDCIVSLAEKQVSVHFVWVPPHQTLTLGVAHPSSYVKWEYPFSHSMALCVFTHHHCYINGCYVWPMPPSADIRFSGISYFFKFVIPVYYGTVLGKFLPTVDTAKHTLHHHHTLKDSVYHSTYFTYYCSLAIIFTLTTNTTAVNNAQ